MIRVLDLMRTVCALLGLLALAAVGCEPGRDVAPAAPPVEPAGRLQGWGPAGARIGVVVFDAWNRTTLAGATVTCHETGDVATTDATGHATLRVPPAPFTITGGASGFGLATVADAATALVGLPLPALAPRIVGVRGTITNVTDTTASRCEVNGVTGGLDPFLNTLGADLYQLTARSGRNFRVTALQIGTGGLQNIAVSPLQWKLPPHKTVATVDFGLPFAPPVISNASGSIAWPAGFTVATVGVRGLAALDLRDVARAADVTVGWGTVGPGRATYQLDYAAGVIAPLAPVALQVEGRASGIAGTQLLARVPNAGGLTPGAFAPVANLAFPAPDVPLTPGGGIAGQGLTPTLTWSGVVAAGCYRVRCTDQTNGNLWDLWLPAPRSRVTIPALPPELQARGLTTGRLVAWHVRAIHDAGLVWTDLTLDRLEREPTGESLAPAEVFFP